MNNQSSRTETEPTSAGVPTPTFWDVKAILDWLAQGRTQQQLNAAHGTTFRWSSRAELLGAFVQLDPTECRVGVDCYQLIPPEMIGNGKGDQTYLVRALRDAGGVDDWGQMPKNGNQDGQFATPLQIAVIVAWIDAGCPE